MRRVTEMRSIPKVGGKIFFPQTQKKKFTMTFAGVTTLVEAKEKQNKSKGKTLNISMPICLHHIELNGIAKAFIQWAIVYF